jgi:Sigma-70, region 4
MPSSTARLLAQRIERRGLVAGGLRETGIEGVAPPNFRRVLELRFLERCSVGETAARMGISSGNARVVQHRALQRAAELGAEVGA